MENMDMECLRKCSLCRLEFYDSSAHVEVQALLQTFSSLLGNSGSDSGRKVDSIICGSCSNLLHQIISARDALNKCVHNLLSTSGRQVTDVERNQIIARLFEDSLVERKSTCENNEEKQESFTDSSSYLVPVQYANSLTDSTNGLMNSATFTVETELGEVSVQPVEMQLPDAQIKQNSETPTTLSGDFVHDENGTIIVTINVDLQSGVDLNSIRTDNGNASGNDNDKDKDSNIDNDSTTCANSDEKPETDELVQINESSICDPANKINFTNILKNDEIAIPSGLLGGDNILSNLSNEDERSENSPEDMEDSVEIEIPPEAIRTKKKARKSHACTVCSRICKTLRDLELHMGVHLQERKFICEVCGLAYRHKKALEVHVALHRGEAKFECEHCHKVFTQKSGLQRHLPIHTGEMAYQCDICGKRFLYNTSFNVHKFTHTKHKEFQCFQCGLSFFSTSHLKRHMKTHTGVKPHVCECCGKCFSERYNLDAHMRIHTGQKSHQCPHCELGFNRKGKMEEHIVQKHTHLSSRVLAS